MSILDDLGDGLYKAGTGVAKFLGFDTGARDDSEAALQAQFQKMAEAYNQYRGFAADTQQSALQSKASMMGPYQAYVQSMMPSLKYDTQGELDRFGQAVQGIHGQVNANAAATTAAAAPAAAATSAADEQASRVVYDNSGSGSSSGTPTRTAGGNVAINVDPQALVRESQARADREREKARLAAIEGQRAIDRNNAAIARAQGRK